MENKIESDRLKVYFRIEEGKPSHTRFERMGVMDKIELDGKHTFCTVEQPNPELKTCYGTGLIGEYVWDEPVLEAKKGQWFPKLGVGLLKQKKNNRKFYFMENYDCKPFDMKYSIEGNKAEFIMEPMESMGYAARLKKTVTVRGNEITAHMSAENTGSRDINAFEYQHNFVNIDNIKTGTGYKLKMPFRGETENLNKCVRKCYKPVKPHFMVYILYILGFFRKPRYYDGFMRCKGDTVEWLKPLSGYSYWAATDKIYADRGLYWRLTNDNSEASVEEHFSFVPARVVNWGMEHCICTEVYAPVHVKPGEVYEWERKWIFND